MNTIQKYTLCALALMLLLLPLTACGSNTLSGNYVPAENEMSNGGVTYYFTKTEVIMSVLDGESMIQYVCNYEIIPNEEDPTKEIITTVYTDIVYYGEDSAIAASVKAMKQSYIDGTVHKADFERGKGYIIINGVKLIKNA